MSKDENTVGMDDAQTIGDSRLDLDELYDQSVDQDAVDKVEADSLLPGGSYRSVPVLSATPSTTKTGPNAGRRGFRLYGSFTSQKPLIREEGLPAHIVTGRLGFGLSPERRNKPDGQPDLQTKLWAQAVRTFIQAAGYKPETNRDVVKFLQDYPFGIRLGQVGVPTESNPTPDGEPDNMVFSLFHLREG